jgi:formate-dependent nitrite reductase cytochrome c552 subunit
MPKSWIQLAQRKAQWQLDFIAAENSLGFHADQEAAHLGRVVVHLTTKTV